MKSYRITVEGRTYDVQIDTLQASPVRVIVDGQAYDVTLEEASGAAPAIRPAAAPPSAAPSSAATPAPAAGGKTLSAPMPGTILEVKVTAGQAVKLGQEICVLEAMKMKNSIRASREAVIARVLVSEGQTVAYGTVLCEFQ